MATRSGITRRTLITTRRRTTAAAKSSSIKASAASLDHERAMDMPTSVRDMDNSTLITLAAMDDHEACSEMLIRHIMTVERCSYASALGTFKEVQTYHKQGMGLLLLPYQIGITSAVSAALLSIPLVFYLPMVHWFNEAYVTTDIPEPQDLETWLEVGAWSWNWMEPPLGHISFFLLCLQFSRYVRSLHSFGLFGMLSMHDIQPPWWLCDFF